MSAQSRTVRLRRLPGIGWPTGISAIVAKELRGRMRGRRAFVVVTIHILLLAGFAWMLQRINEESIAMTSVFGGQATFASASVGRGIFIGLLLLQTLMVAVLAPAATAGAISGEREHQTIDLLTVTPISSVAIVVGKLFSALAWIFLLILASIPVTALVFLFGGVAPDDVVRGYVVLAATAIGFGSIGIFFSAVTRRTGASTGLTLVATLVLVIGSVFVWIFLAQTGQTNERTGLRPRPPEAILYLNPFIAQADVACGTEPGYGGSCSFIDGFLDVGGPILVPPVDPGIPRDLPSVGDGLDGDVGGVGFDEESSVEIVILDGKPIIDRVDPGTIGGESDVVALTIASTRDRFWPKTVVSLLLLATVLTLASVQFVSPTRRWRPRLPGSARPVPGAASDA
jgi:ABC-type transport system involved in multi-copper enzyme maturation permease subunit